MDIGCQLYSLPGIQEAGVDPPTGFPGGGRVAELSDLGLGASQWSYGSFLQVGLPLSFYQIGSCLNGRLTDLVLRFLTVHL